MSLDRLRYQVVQRTSVEELLHFKMHKFESKKGFYIEKQLIAEVLDKTVEFTPSSWWQHFKKDCFPKWALKRWPVQWQSVRLIALKGDFPDCCETFETYGEVIFKDVQD